MVCIMVVCLLLETHWLSTALQICDVMFVVPVFQTAFLFFNVAGGAVFFEEFNCLSLRQRTLVVGGIICCSCGVALLSSNRNISSDETKGQVESNYDDPDDDLGPEDKLPLMMPSLKRRES